MRIIGDSCLDEPCGAKILGMRGGRAPQSRRLYAGMAITHYIRRPIPCDVVAVGRGFAPDIFNMKKCVKSSSQKFQSRRIYPECNLDLLDRRFLLIVEWIASSAGPAGETQR